MPYNTFYKFYWIQKANVMNLLPLNQLGPHELPAHHVRFGYLLPWVSAIDGNKLFVKVIHEDDQFLQNIPPLRFQLGHDTHPDYGDHWSSEVIIQESDRPTPASSWGKEGRYVYIDTNLKVRY